MLWFVAWEGGGLGLTIFMLWQDTLHAFESASPKTSSPTSAAAIAFCIEAVGFVTVSERRSTTGGVMSVVSGNESAVRSSMVRAWRPRSSLN